MNLRILYQDEDLVAVDKPAGFHVHPPEDQTHRIARSQNCLYLLRKQIDQHLYPVHRLDRATSGVVVFALKPEMAKALGALFQERKMAKRYFCVVRGRIEGPGEIHHPLKSEDNPEVRLESSTYYQSVAHVELPFPVEKYPTSRYSLLSVQPVSGRRHQIRRHFCHISHPLIGDTVYGNGNHNRFFRERLNISGLLLKAYSLEFEHPRTGEPIRLRTRWGSTWHQVFDMFGICPV